MPIIGKRLSIQGDIFYPFVERFAGIVTLTKSLIKRIAKPIELFVER